MPLPGQSGFALVEVIISATIVVILASGTLFAIQAAQKSSAEERHRSTAHGLAQEDQARMRAFRISSLSNYSEERAVDGGDGSYSVSSRADFVTDSTGTASCEQNSASPDYIRITSDRHLAVHRLAAAGADPVDRRAAQRRDRDEQGRSGGLGAGRLGPADPGHRPDRHRAGPFSGETERERLRDLRQPAGRQLHPHPQRSRSCRTRTAMPPGPLTVSVVELATNTVALQLDEPGGVDVTFSTMKSGQLSSRRRSRSSPSTPG